MANIITLPSSPQPWEVIQGFVDRYTANRRAQQDQDLKRQQLQQTGDYQNRMAKVQEDTFKLAQDDALYKQAQDRYGRWYQDAINPAVQSGRPEDFQSAQQAIQELGQKDPGFLSYAAATQLRLRRGPLPADQERASTQGTFTSAAQQVQNAVGQPQGQPATPTPTTRPFTGPMMAGAGGPTPPATPPQGPQTSGMGSLNPQAMELFHKRNFGNVGQSQQALGNLEAQDPRAGGYGKYLQRSAGDLPTASQDLAAKTQITTEGMRQTGETKRKQMEITASTSTANVGDRDIKTTVSGKKYADVSMYSGKLKDNLVAEYRNRGIPVIDKKDMDAIREIDNARLNQSVIQSQFTNRLPKDATGRVMGGALSNKLSSYFQTDEYLASTGALRAAAIQALRATAGSKGLRINQAEIAMAVENDIPKITDTVGVALHKLSNVAQMLDSAENATLGTFAAGGQGGPSPGEAWAQKHLGKK